MRDPQRVCQLCHAQLLPLQHTLTTKIANHQRTNSIDIVSSSLRRYFNMPFSITLGSEIRKAAYSLQNIFGTSNQLIKDKQIPLGMLIGAVGLVFLTVAKGGFMLGGRLGTGLVVVRLSNEQWSAPSAIGEYSIVNILLILQS